MVAQPKPPAALLALSGVKARQRKRDGSWRVWWEPSAAQRRAGMVSTPLDEWHDRPTATTRQATNLAKQAAAKVSGPARQKQAVRHQSVQAATQLLLTSQRFRDASAAHQRNLRYDCRCIDDAFPGRNITTLDAPALYAWYDIELEARSPRMARKLMGTMSLVMAQAIRKGWRKDNPCIGLQKEGAQPKRGMKRIATWAEVDALRDAAARLDMPNMRLAIGLGFYAGQRPTDYRTAVAADFRMHRLTGHDGTRLPPRLCWGIMRSKRQTASWLAIHYDLVDELRTMLARRAPDQRVILRDGDGAEMTEFQMIGEFDKVRTAAAASMPSVADITMRVLRRSFSALVREAGIHSDDTDDALGNTAGTDAAMRQAYNPASDRSAAKAVDALRRPGETMSRAEISARLDQLDLERTALLNQLAQLDGRKSRA